MIVTDWPHLYGEGWQREIVPEAFSHPAKFSRALIRHIYDHCVSEGWLREGDTVIDPFGGVALGGLDAMRLGAHWVGIELEMKFVALGTQNIALWNSRYAGHFAKWGTARLIQGDSRRLLEVIRDAGLAVTSPPFGDGQPLVNPAETYKGFEHVGSVKQGQDSYGSTPGNLGNLRADEKGFAAAVSSPPYSHKTEPGRDGNYEREMKLAVADRIGQSGWGTGYGDAPGQLGNMADKDFTAAVSSPPFLQTNGGTNVTSQSGPLSDPALIARHAAGNAAAGYGDGDASLSNMPEGDAPTTILLASQDNRSTISIKEIEPCQPVKPAVSKLPDEANGAESALISNGAKRLRGARSQRTLELNSRSRNTTSLWKDIRQSRSTTGPEEMIVGADTLGELNVAQHLNETVTSASDVTQQNGFKSTTKKTGRKQTVSGTTNPTILKPSAPNAILNNTAPNGLKPSALIAESITEQRTLRLTVPQNAGENLISEHNNDSTQSEANTFWEAARLIVAQTYAALRPGGHAVWVVKSFVRNKAIVDFPGQWRALCESVGFTTLHEHHALLTEDHGTQTAMDGNHKHYIKKRVSFFRRLAEKKGSPPILYEVVLCMVKP